MNQPTGRGLRRRAGLLTRLLEHIIACATVAQNHICEHITPGNVMILLWATLRSVYCANLPLFGQAQACDLDLCCYLSDSVATPIFDSRRPWFPSIPEGSEANLRPHSSITTCF